MMQRRRIGSSGPVVSPLAIGSYHTYDRIRFHETVELLRSALEAGINFFDVGVYDDPQSVFNRSDPMPPCHTDVIFGRAVNALGLRRPDYVVCTKLWLEGYPGHSLETQLDRALFRIGLDYADIAVLGDIPDSPVEIAAVTADMGRLVADGRLRSWGVNCWSASDLRTACEAAHANGTAGPQMAQLKYTVARRSIPEGAPYRELYAKWNISLQASNIFEGGILAGHPAPHRGIGRGRAEVRSRISEIGPRLAAIARSLDATPAQLVIAFCLANPATVNVLFGASRLTQLTENLGALSVLERVGAQRIRQAVDELWIDRDLVSPESTCSRT